MCVSTHVYVNTLKRAGLAGLVGTTTTIIIITMTAAKERLFYCACSFGCSCVRALAFVVFFFFFRLLVWA